MAGHPHGKYRKKAPSRGGQRANQRHPFVDEELLRLIRKCETARERDAELNADEKETVKQLHAKLVQIMLDPGRHAQTQAGIVRTLLDELTGKMPDKLQAEVEQITVQIVKKEVPQSPPTPATGKESTDAK